MLFREQTVAVSRSATPQTVRRKVLTTKTRKTWPLIKLQATPIRAQVA